MIGVQHCLPDPAFVWELCFRTEFTCAEHIGLTRKRDFLKLFDLGKRLVLRPCSAPSAMSLCSS